MRNTCVIGNPVDLEYPQNKGKQIILNVGSVGGNKNQDWLISYFNELKSHFTSTSEGFPNALAEAMAAGCACISYDCVAGPSDIIDDGINGFLIPVGDEEQYKEKLQLLMQDEDLRERFGIAAREKMKQFEASKIARRFYEFHYGVSGIAAFYEYTTE